jgi:hypothetical protein
MASTSTGKKYLFNREAFLAPLLSKKSETLLHLHSHSPYHTFLPSGYPVIPYLKCYHDTTFKISKYKWNFLKENCECSQDMTLQFLELLELNLK